MRDFSWQESTKHIVSNSFFDTWQKEPYFQSSFARHSWCAMFMNCRWPSKFWESRDISNHQFSRDFLKFQSFWYFRPKRYCRPLYDISDHYARILPTIKRYCRPSKDISNRIRKKNSHRRTISPVWQLMRAAYSSALGWVRSFTVFVRANISWEEYSPFLRRNLA